MRIYLIISISITCFASIYANESEEIKRFVSNIYHNYQVDSNYDCYGPSADTIFAPELLKLIKTDGAITPQGDVGFLDYIVFCSCQDVEGIKLDMISVLNKAGQFYAEVKLSFLKSPDKITITLHVVKIKFKWFVSDIQTKDLPSLSKALKAYISKYSPK